MVDRYYGLRSRARAATSKIFEEDCTYRPPSTFGAARHLFNHRWVIRAAWQGAKARLNRHAVQAARKAKKNKIKKTAKVNGQSIIGWTLNNSPVAGRGARLASSGALDECQARALKGPTRGPPRSHAAPTAAPHSGSTAARPKNKESRRSAKKECLLSSTMSGTGQKPCLQFI